MLSLQSFSELLQALYSAPLHDSEWVHFLNLLCKATGSSGTYFFSADARLGLAVRAQGGNTLSSPTLEMYREKIAPHDPYRWPIIRGGHIGVLDCNSLVEREQMMQSGLYQDIIQPAGLAYPGLMIFSCTLRRFEAISLWRTEEEGPITPEVTYLLELLFPHVRQALEIRQALGVANELSHRAGFVADVSDRPAMLLSFDGICCMPTGRLRRSSRSGMVCFAIARGSLAALSAPKRQDFIACFERFRGRFHLHMRRSLPDRCNWHA